MTDKLLDRDLTIIDIENIIQRCCFEYDEFGTQICSKCPGCEFWSEEDYMCCSYSRKEAIALYNAGYRKVADDEIVVKKSNVLAFEREVFKFAFEKGMQFVAEKLGIDLED